MKISKISYEREILINVRRYENVKHAVEMEATVEADEDPAEAFGELKAHINMGLLAAAVVTIRHLDPHKREQLLKENGWLDDYAVFLEAEEEIRARMRNLAEAGISPAVLSKSAQDFVAFVDGINAEDEEGDRDMSAGNLPLFRLNAEDAEDAEDEEDKAKEPPILKPGRRAH